MLRYELARWLRSKRLGWPLKAPYEDLAQATASKVV